MNDWKKKWVSLRRTCVSKRTVRKSTLGFHCNKKPSKAFPFVLLNVITLIKIHTTTFPAVTVVPEGQGSWELLCLHSLFQKIRFNVIIVRQTTLAP